jgi:hypothetical protein
VADGQNHLAWRTYFTDVILLGVVFYIGVTTLRHSDEQLINPETAIKVSQIVDAIKLPTGTILAPFLDIQIPIFWYYLGAPVVVLIVHAMLLRAKYLKHGEGRLLSWVKLALPPAVLFLIAWKFAPYAKARPPDGSTWSGGSILTGWHTVLLALDAAALAYALLSPLDQRTDKSSSRTLDSRGWTRALVAVKLVAFLSLPVLALRWWFSGRLSNQSMQPTLVLLGKMALMIALGGAAAGVVRILASDHCFSPE